MTRSPRAALAVAVLAVAVLGGCAEPEPEPEAAPVVPTAAPTPTTPPLVPVQGEVSVRTVDATLPVILGFDGDDEIDQDAVAAVTAVVAERLDSYLDSLQADTPELLPLDGAWLADDPTGAAVMAGLASGADRVAGAVYDIVIEVDDGPSLAAVEVAVTHVDGSVATASLLFDVADGQSSLLLVGPGGAA